MHNFAPSTGTIDYLYTPVGNLGTRIDTDIYTGLKISPYYDSMIAKLITLGQDRTEAIKKIKRLLEEMVILGIKTNQKFHVDLLEDDHILKGEITTEYVEKIFLPSWRKKHAVIC